MKISIETPVFKGVRLQRCIDSVLHQSSPDWELSMLWDGGDEESRLILERLERRKLPNVHVHFAENRGIARARRFLSEHSRGEYILPLDDDDALPQNAVERFLSVAAEKPWAAVIRGQRKIIDEEGKVLDTPAWFPFEPRHYQHGMVTDLMNHTQPYLISRWAYERTSGWEGFEDFGFAGEDCDIYLKLEEVGTIELLDEALYYYRVHDRRQSLVLTNEAAFEMWRRLADKTTSSFGSRDLRGITSVALQVGVRSRSWPPRPRCSRRTSGFRTSTASMGLRVASTAVSRLRRSSRFSGAAKRSATLHSPKTSASVAASSSRSAYCSSWSVSAASSLADASLFKGPNFFSSWRRIRLR